jgi:YD repeat-containing protein
VTHYDSAGRIDYVQDAAGNLTGFTYDPATGRKVSQTDAQGKVTRFAYDPRGEVIRTWGDVPYPVGYTYDALGRMTAMQTFRTDEGFDGATFPRLGHGRCDPVAL